MTAYRWIELVCDVPTCGDNFREHMPTNNIEAARREAKEQGWSSSRGVDLCPWHRDAK